MRGRLTHLDSTAVGLDVDDVSHLHFLLLQALVDGRVQLELLGAFGRLQTNDDVAYCLPVPLRAEENDYY